MRLLAAALTVAMIAVPASAQADGDDDVQQEEVTLPAKIVIKKGNRKGDPGNCSAVSFAMWKHIPGTVSAHVHYRWRGNDYDKAADRPFDNRFEWVAKYRVPENHDWIQLGKSWVDGPQPNNCSKQAAQYRADYSPNAVVDLVIESGKSCRSARYAYRTWDRQVRKLERQRDDTPGEDADPEVAEKEHQLEADLTTAKRERRQAWAKVKDVCD